MGSYFFLAVRDLSLIFEWLINSHYVLLKKKKKAFPLPVVMDVVVRVMERVGRCSEQRGVEARQVTPQIYFRGGF